MRAKSMNESQALNESDTTEYVIGQLNSIKDKTEKLIDAIDTVDDPWVMAQITKAQDYITSVCDHIHYHDGDQGPEMITDQPLDVEVPLDGERVDMEDGEITMEPLQGARIDLDAEETSMEIDPEDELDNDDIEDSSQVEFDSEEFVDVNRSRE